MTAEPWTGTPAPLARPAAGEAHVWRVSLRAAREEVAHLAALLAPGERERAGRFRRPGDQRAFVVARGTLRRLLASYLRVDPAALSLSVSPRGKPYLLEGDRRSDLRFNLSHAGDLALVAVAWGREVGVDLERLDRAVHPVGIAERFFDPEEAAFLAGLPAAARTGTFFRLWACKEAYAKATGLGIAGCDLSSFRVLLEGGAPPTLRGVSGWTLHELPAGVGWAAALAVEGPCAAPDVRPYRWSGGWDPEP